MSERRRHTNSNSQRRRPPALLFWAFVVVVVALPWPLGANRDWIWPVYALAAGALLFVLHGGAMLGAWRVAESAFAARLWIAALLLWGAWPLLQLAAPGATAAWDPAAAWSAFGVGGLAVALALLVAGTVDSRKRLQQLAIAVFLVGVVQAIYGLVLALSGSEGLVFESRVVYRGHATGSFVNRNHFAGFIELTAAVGLGLLVGQLASAEAVTWRERLRHWLQLLLGPRTWLRGLLIVMVLALVLTHSRGGNLAFFVALGAAGLVALAAMRPLPRSLGVLLLSIVVLDLVVLGSWFGIEQVTERVRETASVAATEGATAADPQRADVSRAALGLFTERPMLGVGAGGFRSGFVALKPDAVTLFYDHAHNDWVQLLGERGLVGLLVWLMIVGASLWQAVRAMRRRDALLRGLGFGCAVGLVALLLHGLVDFNLQIPANAALFFVVAAIGVVAGTLPRRSHRDDAHDDHERSRDFAGPHAFRQGK